ncbi:hypothetical protein BdWA1_003152 [Babesia duncani]|uniref:Uncharacterized protein n=1 Tax=Babesia duncani TaxID=323732 RepID=A0AAD9UN65_9APIC|nr:hypothetical protein BdWA1_003152 [Babesia duncani]
MIYSTFTSRNYSAGTQTLILKIPRDFRALLNFQHVSISQKCQYSPKVGYFIKIQDPLLIYIIGLTGIFYRGKNSWAASSYCRVPQLTMCK